MPSPSRPPNDPSTADYPTLLYTPTHARSTSLSHSSSSFRVIHLQHSLKSRGRIKIKTSRSAGISFSDIPSNRRTREYSIRVMYVVCVAIFLHCSRINSGRDRLIMIIRPQMTEVQGEGITFNAIKILCGEYEDTLLRAVWH